MKTYSIEVKSGGVWREWGFVKGGSPREAKRRFLAAVPNDGRAYRLFDPNYRVIDLKNAK